MSISVTKPVPTLADVAKHARVSTATVSRCLNSPEQVLEKTRDRVLKTVADLGYTPNFGARALAARRTNTIAAVIPTMENAIFARGLQAFQEELGLHGFTLLLASSSYREDLEEQQIRTLVARGADALLLIGHHRDAAIYDFLAGRGVPALVAWAYDAAVTQLSIGFDNRSAMAELAEHVVSLGHRRIGFISAERASNDRARGRVAGVRDAMARNGLDPDDLTIVEIPYSIDNGATAFAELMSVPRPPSVVMCGNDVLAVGALLMARRMGLAVPGEVSVTGFDDIELARVADPALTTVHVPHRQMGRDAAQLLVGLLKGKLPAGSVQLKTEIRLRDTLGPATAR